MTHLDLRPATTTMRGLVAAATDADLARALGQPFTAREEDVAACLGFAEAFSTPETAEMRGDAFGEVLAVREDASALERLLGLMGRRADR